MKVETVTISGLRSHRGDPPTVVDLSGKSLVAVVGPTGAGKSSILEAICFALYGEATFGGKAYKELSTDGRSEIAVQMTFSVGEDRYQLVRSVSPNRNGVFGAKATWLRKVDGEGNALTHVDQVRKVDAAIRTLLGGMDRLQFCQAVLLAQNRFAELLETDERKRNELLDILLALTALADARKALQVTDRAAQRNHERLADRRSALPPDPAAAAAEAGARAAAMRQLSGQAERGAATLKGLVDHATALSGEAGELRSAAALLVAGRDGNEHLADLEANLEVLVETDERLAGELEEAERSKELATSALDDARLAMEAVEQEHGQAGTHDVAVQQLDEIGRLLADRRAQQDVAGTARDELAALDGKLEVATAKKSAAAAALEGKERAAAAAQQVAASARERFAERQQDVAAAVRLAEQLAEMAGDLVPAAGKLADDDAAAAAVDEDAAGKESACRKAADGLEQAQREASAAAAAHGHHPGDPCPVCQRKLPSAWEPPGSPDLDAARRAEKEAREAYGLALGRKTDASGRRGEAAGAFKTAVSNLAAKAAELASAARDHSLTPPPCPAAPEIPSELPLEVARGVAEGATAALAQVGSWRAGLDEILVPLQEAVSDAAAEAEKADEAMKEARRLAEQATGEVSDLEAERAGVDQTRKGAESAAGAAATRIDQLEHAIPQRWSAAVDPDSAEPVSGAREACLADKEAVAAAVAEREAAASALAGAERRLGSLKEERSTTVNEPLAAARSALSGLVQNVAALARMVELPEPHALPATASPPACLEAARAARGLADQGRRLALGRAESLEQQREDLVAPAAAAVDELLHLKMEADPEGVWIAADPDRDAPLSPATSEAVQQVVGAATTAATAARLEAESAEGNVQEARQLDERLSALGAWRSDLAAALEVLKKDNFPTWARDRRIAELIDVASGLLGGMTGGRYRFDSHLRVSDEVAGAVRSATTLSGGEKFEAALALALGVAEIAGRSGIRFDTLFLDEGFAGLDQPNLDRALDAIETEVEQGRRVVLITHIGAVADRIRDVLFIEPDGMGGSRARWLDEEERFDLGADLDLAHAAAGGRP